MRAIRGWAGLLVAVGLLAAPSVASAFQPASGRWNGSIDGYKEPLHFNVGHSAIGKFDVPTLGCLSVTGYQLETFYIPHALAHGRSFDGKFHPVKGVTEEIKGTFTSSTTAKGIAHEVYPCDTGDAPWHANLGRFKPVHIKPKVPTCPVTGCLASNGVFIKVTGVDRTIKTIDDPSNVFDTSADPAFSSGVGVSVVGTDRSGQDPVFFAPSSNFQLRLSSGVLIPTYDTLSTVVSQNGAKYTCSDPSVQQQLTHGGSFGPNSVCFPTANTSGLTLYYMPDGFDIDAKIPLG